MNFVINISLNMNNMVTISNLKEYVEIYPDVCCMTVASVTTILTIYYGSSNDIFFTFSGLAAGFVGGPLIEIFDYVYDLGFQRGVKEAFNSEILISNAVTTGVAVGSMVGSITGKIFNVFPTTTFNGLTLIDGLLAGMLVGHGLDLYLRAKKTDKTSLVTINTIAGAGAGFAISTAVVMKLFNKPIDMLIESINIITNEALVFTESTVTMCYGGMTEYFDKINLAIKGLIGANKEEEEAIGSL